MCSFKNGSLPFSWDLSLGKAGEDGKCSWRLGCPCWRRSGTFGSSYAVINLHDSVSNLRSIVLHYLLRHCQANQIRPSHLIIQRVQSRKFSFQVQEALVRGILFSVWIWLINLSVFFPSH